MTPTSDPRQLAAEAATLNEQVARLSERLYVSQQQVRRMHALTMLTAALAALAVLTACVSIYLWGAVRHTTLDNRANAELACQNTNQTRAANLRLWGYVLDASAARPNMTAKQRLQIEQLRTWVTKLYAPHDCADLARPYPIPSPPPILKDDKG